jgi:hypothetical protein
MLKELGKIAFVTSPSSYQLAIVPSFLRVASQILGRNARADPK